MSRGGGGNSGGSGGAGGKILQFKLVLLGESAVGKSSLVLRFVKGSFHEFQVRLLLIYLCFVSCTKAQKLKSDEVFKLTS